MNKKAIFLSLIAALMLGFGHWPSWGWLYFLGTSLFYFLLASQAKTLRHAFALGLFINTIQSLIAAPWFFSGIQTWYGYSIIKTIFLVLAAASFNSWQIPTSAILFIFLRKKLNSGTAIIFCQSLAMTIVDQILPQGIPLPLLHGEMMYDSGLYQWIDLFGEKALTFIWLILSLSLAHLFHKFSVFIDTSKPLHLKGHSEVPTSRALFREGLLLATLLLGIHTSGHWHKNQISPASEPLSISVIQANIPNEWKRELSNPLIKNEILKTHLKLSSQALASSLNHKLLLWPETAIPDAISTSQGPTISLSKIVNFLENAKVNLLAGAYSAETENRLGNAIFSLGEDRKKIEIPYLKKILFPFVEDKLNIHPGESNRTFTFDQLRIAPFICFEILSSARVKEQMSLKPNLIAHFSNEGWFVSDLIMKQHLAFLRARAIEYRVRALRISNSGFSSYINERGEILTSLPSDFRGYFNL